MRLPKELFYTHRVVGSTTPDIHIIGHWTYPANTAKTMFVGTITVTATRSGLTTATASVPSKAVAAVDGILPQ